MFTTSAANIAPGAAVEVEICAAAVPDGERACFGFFIRDIGRRIGAESAQSVRLPKSVEQITQQIGRVPLKDLVRQSTDLVEKLCIGRGIVVGRDRHVGVDHQAVRLHRAGHGRL